MDHHLDRINTGSLVSKEEQVSLNLNSNYLVYLAKVINMIRLCSNSTKILKVLDSQTISNREMEMLVEYKTLNQTLQQTVLFNLKVLKIVDLVKIKTAKTNTINILRVKLQHRAMVIMAE